MRFCSLPTAMVVHEPGMSANDLSSLALTLESRSCFVQGQTHETLVPSNSLSLFGALDLNIHCCHSYVHPDWRASALLTLRSHARITKVEHSCVLFYRTSFKDTRSSKARA